MSAEIVEFLEIAGEIGSFLNEVADFTEEKWESIKNGWHKLKAKGLGIFGLDEPGRYEPKSTADYVASFQWNYVTDVTTILYDILKSDLNLPTSRYLILSQLCALNYTKNAFTVTRQLDPDKTYVCLQLEPFLTPYMKVLRCLNMPKHMNPDEEVKNNIDYHESLRELIDLVTQKAINADDILTKYSLAWVWV